MEEYKIFWKYSYKGSNNKRNVTSETITECFIERKKGNTTSVVSSGKSICKKNDNFSKRLGRKKSFERAVSLLKHDKSLRANLWDQFATISPKSLKSIK